MNDNEFHIKCEKCGTSLRKGVYGPDEIPYKEMLNIPPCKTCLAAAKTSRVRKPRLTRKQKAAKQLTIATNRLLLAADALKRAHIELKAACHAEPPQGEPPC